MQGGIVDFANHFSSDVIYRVGEKPGEAQVG
jgi:hypothetical protein